MVKESVSEFIEEIKKYPWIEGVKTTEPLSNKTSVRVGGPAKYFQKVHNQSELINLLKVAKKTKTIWFLIGKGTNLLIPDEGFSGVVIQLSGDFEVVKKTSKRDIYCGAGASNRQVSRFAKQFSLSGAEFLLTIPGSIGGALFMNAGAHGNQIKDIVQWIDIINEEGEISRLNKDSLDLSYRHSVLMEKKLIALSAGFCLSPGDTWAIEEKEKSIQTLRKNNQPINLKTWGSVFMNPEGDSAGRLIEACGLKGKGVGQARICTRHANFIENTGKASFEELMATVQMAKKQVLDKYGIDLKTEGQILSKN